MPALFYADGGLLLVKSYAEAEGMIGVVVRVAGRCGLNINTGMSSVLLTSRQGRANSSSK